MEARSFYVYILASKIGGTLYIGVTNDLIRRVGEHKSKDVEGFTRHYGVDRLVYFECFEDIENAIRREKRLKKWTRAWKISLIEKENPHWNDLRAGICRECRTTMICHRPAWPGNPVLWCVNDLLQCSGILGHPHSRVVTVCERW